MKALPRLAPTALAAVLASLPCFAQRTDGPPQEAPAPQAQLNVHRLTQTVATDLVETIQEFLRDEDAAVQAHPRTNSLLVRASEERMPDIVRLIERLDQNAGEDPVAAATQDSASDRFEFEAAEDCTVADLVRAVQTATGQVYTFDAERIGKRPIRLIGRVSMEPRQAAGWLQTVLYVNGLGLATEGTAADGTAADVLHIVALDGAPKQKDPNEETATQLDLVHLEPRQVATDMRAFFGPALRITAVGESRTLALGGPKQVVERAESLIRHADESVVEPTQVMKVRLEHVQADSVALLLKQLFPSLLPQTAGAGRGPLERPFHLAIAGPEVLILRAATEQMPQLLEVIRSVDVAATHGK